MSAHDYIARYQHQSHEQLYNSLHPADAHSLQATSDAWHKARLRLHDLAAQIQQDVSDLMRTWSGSAGAEYEQRLHTVTSFSCDVASSAGQVSDGLGRLVGPVHTAKDQARSENPADTDNNDKAVTLTVIGAVAGGPVGAGIGAFVGHKMDEDEKEKARQRMIETISQLAAAYEVTTHQAWPTAPDAPPAGLPGSVVGAAAGAAATWAAGHLSSPGSTGAGTERVLRDAQAPQIAGQVPGTGLSHTVIDGGEAHGLDSSVLIGAAAAAAAGLAGAVSGAMSSASLTGGGRTPASSLFREDGGVKGVLGKDGAPPVDDEEARARRGGAQLSPEEEAAANRAGQAEREASGRNAVAARGLPAADEEDEDERLTWLTEDEMSWSGGEPTPPPVLGSAAS